MARFVELESISMGKFWINPEHVTAIHVMDGITVLTRSDGASIHVKASVEQLLEKLK